MILNFPYIPSRPLDYDESIAIQAIRSEKQPDKIDYNQYIVELYRLGSQFDNKENNAYRDRFEYVNDILCWAQNMEKYVQ